MRSATPRASGSDAGMLVVSRAVDPLGLEVDVAVPHFLDVQAAERLAVRSGQLDDVTLADVEVGLERDRDRPDLARPRGEAHVLAHRAPVVRAHEAGERREAA